MEHGRFPTHEEFEALLRRARQERAREMERLAAEVAKALTRAAARLAELTAGRPNERYE